MFMSFVLGFSAGVMIMVSFVELLQGSIEYIGFLPANLGFFAGILTMFLVSSDARINKLSNIKNYK